MHRGPIISISPKEVCRDRVKFVCSVFGELKNEHFVKWQSLKNRRNV